MKRSIAAAIAAVLLAGCSTGEDSSASREDSVSASVSRSVKVERPLSRSVSRSNSAESSQRSSRVEAGTSAKAAPQLYIGGERASEMIQRFIDAADDMIEAGKSAAEDPEAAVAKAAALAVANTDYRSAAFNIGKSEEMASRGFDQAFAQSLDLDIAIPQINIESIEAGCGGGSEACVGVIGMYSARIAEARANAERLRDELARNLSSPVDLP
jgi:hypothetical protein